MERIQLNLNAVVATNKLASLTRIFVETKRSEYLRISSTEFVAYGNLNLGNVAYLQVPSRKR